MAPFHQWTPDVYQGAPTPVSAFMAVATKAAAFAVFLRLFDHALGLAQLEWGPALAALAAVATDRRGQRRRHRPALPQAAPRLVEHRAGGLPLAGVVVGSELGLRATAFYLAAYLLMNLTAFAVVVARERVSEHGDDLASLENLGRAQPSLAWPMTIAMLLALGRVSGDRRLHGKVLFDRRRGGGGLCLARRCDRRRVGRVARVLPARDSRDVDGACRWSCPTCRGAA